MKVHMLNAGFCWEGSRVLAVYGDEKAAKEMCAKLEKHAEDKPRQDDLDAYLAAYDKWVKDCPLKGAHGFDYYNIISKEVI